ncbi:MAG: hypothetical protein PHR06_02105 [Candidatus Cloacimonetes bacterium]|nr:hypothetical protein [Candidatus Cloacimonadota bacterium]
MKKWLLLLFAPLFLIASDNLELPQVHIYGQTVVSQDSLRVNELLKPYYRLSNIDDFEYHHVFSAEQTEYLGYEQIRQKIISLKLYGGNNYLAGGNLLITTPYFLKSVESTFYRDEIRKDWEMYNFNSTVRAAYNNVDFLFFPYTGSHKTPLSDKKISYSGMNVEMKLNSPWETEDFALESIQLAGNVSESETSSQSSFDDFDFHSDVKFSFYPLSIDSEIKFQYLLEEYSGSFQVSHSDMYFFDMMGFSLFFCKKDILPSVVLKKEIKISNSFDFIFDNSPELSSFSRTDYLKENPYQHGYFSASQTMSPLNARIALSGYTTLPFTLYAKSKWQKNLPYYLTGKNSLYSVEEADVFTHTFGGDIFHSNQWLDFINSFQYNIYDLEKYDSVPYQPEIINRTSLTVKIGNFRITAGGEYRAGIIDSRKEKMDDYYKLDSQLEWMFSSDLTFFAMTENLLDFKISKYEILPYRQIQAKAGMILNF